MTDQRLHYMDNLRAFAMLLGVVFHAALAYSANLHQVWLPADANHSAAIDVVFDFTHFFRMPLFFLVAGFFACLLYEKRGLGRLIKNRLTRVAAPFVIFLPVLTGMMIAAVVWAMTNVENQSPMMAVIASFADNPDAPKPPPSTMHLWFLYYLIMFYVLTVAVVQFGRINLVSPVSRFASNAPLWFIVLAPLCLAPALVASGMPYPTPEYFTPQLWALWLFGCFFFLGWVFYRNGDFVERFRPYWKPVLVVDLALYAVFIYLAPNEPLTFEQLVNMMTAPPEITVNSVVLATLGAYIMFYSVLVLLILGKTFFDKRNAAVRFTADASYWIYLIHLPVLFAIQFALLDTNWPLWAEFTVSFISTFAIGILTYVLLVRWTPIGWLLNGRKKKIRSPDAPPPAMSADVPQ